MNGLDGFLAGSLAAKSVGELVERFEAAIREFGVKFYAYHHLIRSFRKIDLAQSLRCAQLPEGWLAHYEAQDYFSIDPIQKTAARRATPFLWDDVRGGDELSARQRQFFADLASAGFGAGVSVPVFSGTGAFSYFCFGSGECEFPLAPEKILQLQLICVAMNLRFDQFSADRADVRLSRREAELAGLIMEGCTNREIATRMGVSVNTVDTLVRRCFSKLRVNSRVALAFAAAARGLALNCAPCPQDLSIVCLCAPTHGPCNCHFAPSDKAARRLA